MSGLIVLAIYAGLFIGAFFLAKVIRAALGKATDYTSLKTVTFGDESAVTADRVASIISVIAVFLVWGAFTGSKLVPIHMPGPFMGDTSFTYTSTSPSGDTADAIVDVLVHQAGADVDAPEVDASTGFAQNDAATVAAWRSVLIRAQANDGDDAKITAIEGKAITPGDTVKVPNGVVTMTAKGSLNFSPNAGWQMEPIWLPAPESVAARFYEIATEGYQNVSLFSHIGWSLWRVVAGFVLGSLVGIPLGYAMGLSGWARGWFDPIVEFMRPVPPLALIPLVIIWFGIGEQGKIVLLFLAALWVMIIAARAGVSGVNITKVQAAYSLGANKWQILRHVVVPNSLPEIFTGARVAMGVCWGTVVAAELVAAEKGIGKMIVTASKFQSTDIVLMGIIVIGLIGFGIDILMRKAENWLVPWKGRS
ncbi:MULTISPECIES: ABC transporter permease [Pacificibacter]|uniref:ABC transporter permease n=1 Tax=Pacificibacter TaxID=1042323 RepID=UPI001C086A17|nr:MULTISPECIES: ABC transporter permease [Pacificibacter]MBU2936774.1 ABC transporter permease [Pacificibacter marinus]MDO6614766.1 ABC transporter permease [Pacificibacter sp. 1_MG-2023]